MLRAELTAANPGVECQTEAENAKLMECRECESPLIVGPFYSAANALCAECRAATPAGATGAAMVGNPVPGKTEPRLAKDLESCLIHKQWGGEQLCVVDPAHGAMELKSVSHNPSYGPSQIVGHKNGSPVYRNDTGESTMHQCNTCRSTLSMSTTAQQTFRRVNEVSDHKRTGGFYRSALGVRDV